MAGKGLTIPLTLDPRDWLRGVRVVEQSLESMEDSLEEVEDVGDKLERALEDNFKDAARAAERAGRDIDDGLEQGLRNGDLKSAAGSIAGEVVDEFVENWGEAVRSGDYASAFRETISQLGQIGGAIGGPAGALAGGALALGLTTAFDKAMASSQEQERIRAAINDIFLGVTDEAAEAGGGSWAAYRDAVVAAARSDDAVAQALGVESFAEAAMLISQTAEGIGQDWENNVILALTDSGPAGENAAKAVAAAYSESNAEITRLEGEIQAYRAAGAQAQAASAEGLLKQEKDRNAAMENGVGWLKTQGTLQEGLTEQAKNQFLRDQKITTEKKDQAAAMRATANASGDVKDTSLPNLKNDTKEAANNLGTVQTKLSDIRTSILNLPDLDIGVTQQTANRLAALARLLNE